jgi:hypothetical protein
MTTIRIKLPTIEQVEFTLVAEQDDVEVRGNAVASGDDLMDKKIEDEIIERLDSGDVWAWACVTVTARWKGLEGVDHLGACSYRDERDFIQSSGYYEEMKKEAYADLIAHLHSLKD